VAAGIGEAGDRGQRQTAYQIRVASRRTLLDEDQADRWDSGRVESDQSLYVMCQGLPLVSHQECLVAGPHLGRTAQRVHLERAGRLVDGLLADADWSVPPGSGVTKQGRRGRDQRCEGGAVAVVSGRDPAYDAPVATRYFRRTLTLPDGCRVVRALAFFAGDDVCVFAVNGTQVGIGRGHPNLIGVDVTGNLHVGDNQLAVAATNAPADVPHNPGGWIGAVRVEFESGPPLVVLTDRSWRAASEPIEGWEKVGATMRLGSPPWNSARLVFPPWGVPGVIAGTASTGDCPPAMCATNRHAPRQVHPPRDRLRLRPRLLLISTQWPACRRSAHAARAHRL